MTTEAATKARWAKYYADPMAKFWERVDRSGGPDACWPWTGAKKRRGYGFVMHRGKAFGAHRLALAGGFSSLPDRSVLACHRCDNPPCCNPAHLFWGTNTDNRRDAVSKGRANGAPRKIDLSQLLKLRAEGRSYSQLAAFFQVNQSSIGKALLRAQSEAR